MAQSAYGAHTRATGTARDTEYDAIARITRRLSQAARTEGDIAGLAAALLDNRKLWSTLAVDVAQPGNPLPADLKARLIYLAEFTDFHSRKVLAGDAPADPLIEVNTAVMRGLQDRGGQP